MPIRFTCPYCHQKLSVGSRKAGSTADCPRCKRPVTIPEPPPIAEPSEGSISESSSEAIEQEPSDLNAVIQALSNAPSHEPARQTAESIPRFDFSINPPPVGQAPTFLPDADEFAGLELVYDTAASQAAPPAPPTPADVIVLPRHIIYVQGGMLSAVALTAFVIGLLMGSVGGSQTAIVPVPCTVTGSVTYVTGPRSRPDAGAVVILLPQSPQRPDEKAASSGLRPSDPPPDEDSKALAILYQAGAAYARSDASGRFEITAPMQGRYWLVVISHEKRRSTTDVKTVDLARLSRFFDNASALLGDRRFQITNELLQGDRQVTIAFD